MIALILLCSPGVALESADWHAAQARQFLKKGWDDDARSQVEAGLLLDPTHVLLNALCVDIARKDADIPRAISCAAQGAAASHGDIEVRAELSRLEGWMRENFGTIHVLAPDGTTRGKLELSAIGLQLDPELRAAASAAAARAREGIALPASLSVPIGDYLLEGATVHVDPGQTTVASLSPSAFAAKAGRGLRLELSAGGAGYLGHGLDNELPGGEFELGLSIPAGALRVGLGAAWELRPYSRAVGGDVLSPYGWGGKIRLGAEFELGTALLFAPAATLKVGQLPGVELSCEENGDDLACTFGHLSTGNEPVYAQAWTVNPGGEVAFAVRLGRSVVGVRGGAAHVFGTIPSPAPVTRSTGPSTYTVEEAEVHAWTGNAAFYYAIGL